MSKTLLIVDDQRLFAEGIRRIVEQISNVEIIAELYDGRDLMPFLKHYSPDVIFLDLNLPGKNGVDLIPEIKTTSPKSFISILSMYSDYDIVKKCKALGADAYLTKDSDIEELKKVLSLDKQSDFYCSKHVDKPPSLKNVKTDSFEKIAMITSREAEIIRFISQGCSSNQISKKLHISKATVQTHRKNIFKKLNVNKVSELVSMAHQYEII